MTFEVRNISCAVGMSRFFGRLVVSEGEVSFLPEGRANSLNVDAPHPIAHRTHNLTLVRGRLLPPWMNSGIVLVDHSEPSPSGVGVVLLTAWQRRSVVDAARSAGFDVTVINTWTSAGGNIGSRSELDRFRSLHP